MAQTPIEVRLNHLKEHLQEENNILHEVVDSFRELDLITYKLGFLSPEQSYATRVSWWPMISILGTYSAGKSTFINHYLGHELQRTGTQAIDDKFTVVCFSRDEVAKTLPGLALDADPRFPFYQISQEISELTTDNTQTVDSYLQLKTSPSERMRGKILIDSPGFDADSQRTSTLRITQHIIDLSDLVLVFFDARHPEPGAMRDTLEYLVAMPMERPDSNKFLYILNQMDITVREDNPEEVVASWQRSLAQAGQTAGRFYRIYNPNVCLPFEDALIKERTEKKCKVDMTAIHNRMEQVGVERAYRVIAMLEHTAKEVENKIVPQLQELIQNWKNRVFWSEVSLGVLLVILASVWFAMTGTWASLSSLLGKLNSTTLGIMLGIMAIVGIVVHVKICKNAAQKIIKRIQSENADEHTREGLVRAFRKNTGTSRALFIWLIDQPVGWSNRTQQRLSNVLGSVNNYVQKLNDRFTNPSGKKIEPTPVPQEATEESKPNHPNPDN
ncbi:MAG: dynamin family protein [Candidatus Parabeggiatoa sp.]|nr:dynamin family protein [Candidatus Parabeggiatoa sp.]